MVNKYLPSSRTDQNSIPWTEIALPLAAAEDAVARLDERLAKSTIRDAWIARTHFSEACASLWIDGELVHIEDLVLHDAHMDIRVPTPELTRAHTILRFRRRIADAKPEWPLSDTGLASLIGRPLADDLQFSDVDRTSQSERKRKGGTTTADAQLAEAFAAIDAAIDRVGKAIARESRPVSRTRSRTTPEPITNQFEEHGDDLTEWRHLVASTGHLPATLAAAIAADAWDSLAPAPQVPWLGRLLTAGHLRERGKAKWHLPCLYDGFKSIDRDKRRNSNSTVRLIAQINAIAAAATLGLNQHDRWLTARTLLARKLDGRRSTSKLPELLDYVLSRPIVSANMIAAELKVTPRGAQNLVNELNLRELTGRGRYRAWAIL